MKMLVKTAMTVLAIAAHYPTARALITYKCHDHDSYFYAAPGSHCTSYYKCQQGAQQQNISCPQGAIFNFQQQRCVRSPSVCYEPVCTGKTDGVYADTSQACHRAIVCKGGRLAGVEHCGSQELHNGQMCQAARSVTCETAEVSSIAYPFSGDRRCYGRSDGNHPANVASKFIVCGGGEVTDIQDCQLGYKFDDSQKKCGLANDLYNQDNVCASLTDGFHTDATSGDCKVYLKCLGGRLVSRHSCGPATVFDGRTCVPDVLFSCPATSGYPIEDFCRDKTNGFHSDPRNGCSDYLKCTGGKTIQTLQCPTGQTFDPINKVCGHEPEASRNCRSLGASQDCQNVATGYYQDRSLESSCTGYYFCKNGEKTAFRCDFGQIFDGENCVASGTYLCPIYDENSCFTKADGYYRDECRSYYLCSGDKKYSFLCLEGQSFDGTKCTAQRTDTCSQVCRGRPDGYHQDVASNCRNYFYCMRGDKIQTLTCRGSKIFDGQGCVSASAYTCPTSSYHSSLNCVQRKCNAGAECSGNGFFADIDSGCEMYYFCIDGKKTTLSCAEGHVFNGELCVVQGTYTCPQYCQGPCV